MEKDMDRLLREEEKGAGNENTENISPQGNGTEGPGAIGDDKAPARSGHRFRRRTPGRGTADNIKANGEELQEGPEEESHRLADRGEARGRRQYDRAEQNKPPPSDGAGVYDLPASSALNLERIAGPVGCLPCSAWNHLCRLGFKMSGYIPAYEKIRTPVNLQEINKNWLSVTIGGLSQLGGRLSRSVCPYVRMHVLNLHSGDYIMSVPLTAANRPSGDSNATQRESHEGHPVPALNTASCQLRARDADVYWDETFLVDAQFSAVTSPNSLLLFEVLDNPPSIKKSHDTGGSGGGKKGKFSTCLAWGYLIPRGTRSGRLNFAIPVAKPSRQGGHVPFQTPAGKNDIEDSERDDGIAESTRLLQGEEEEDVPYLPARLQLYEYRNESWLIEGAQRRAMNWPPKPSYGYLKTPTNLSAHNMTTAKSGQRSVPEVYLQWRRQKHIKAEGVLSIVLSYQPRSASALGHVVAQEGDAVNIESAVAQRQGDGDEKKSLAKEEAERAALRAAVSRRSRAPSEPTVIPNRILHRCQAGGVDGSVVSTYSNNGILLACASKSSKHGVSHVAPRGGGSSKYPGVLYALSILDADTGDRLWVDDLAHFGVIYDIKWSSNDETLACCSADGRIRVYSIKLVSRGFRDHKEGLLDNVQDRRAESKRMSAPKQSAGNNAASALGGISAAIAVTTGRVLESFPPVFIYCLVLQETFGTTGTRGVRILSGGSDGRIKVWDAGGQQCGELLSYDPSKEAANLPIFSPHEKAVQAMVIDVKSRYLYSADAAGMILMWRQDAKGWYQIMRRLKKDDVLGLSINSMCIYTTPVSQEHMSNTKAYAQTKSYMLIMACAPSSGALPSTKPSGPTVSSARPVLQLYDLSSYKPIVSYSGFAPPIAAFTRASISRDGRYVATCCALFHDSAAGGVKEDKSGYTIKCWDAFTGHHVRARLSELHWAFPIRTIDWSPRQNAISVSMTGPGASVCILSAEKISAKAAAAILAEAVPNPVLDAATTDGDTENSTVIKAGEKHPPAGKLLDRSLASFSSADRRGVSAGSVGRSGGNQPVGGLADPNGRGRGMAQTSPLRRLPANMSPKGMRSQSPMARGVSPGRSPVPAGTIGASTAESNAEKTKKLKEYMDSMKARKNGP